MIITRTPLRISIGGGGTDLPSYYRRQGGYLLSAAINRYIYIAINDTFTDDYVIKYSSLERTERVDDISHPLVREALRLHPIGGAKEIVSIADIPAGTGLGSSGAFTVGLLRALYAYKREHITAGALAEEACHIEIDLLSEPVGKQDQYIAAFGGLSCFEIDTEGRVRVSPLAISNETLRDLEEHLLLFFTGYSRRAGEVLLDQDRRSAEGDQDMLDRLAETEDIGRRIGVALEAGDTIAYGALMHEHWMNKRDRSPHMSNSAIDRWYQAGIDNGAVGGKLVGAGAGGFLLFYAKESDRLRDVMAAEGLREVRFFFDHDGSTVMTELARSVQVLILAGGLGTRMRPQTDTVPKALLPVAGRPFAEHQIELLAANGVEDIVFSIAYRGDMIRDVLGDGRNLGVAIRYVDEGEDRRGTGGAVRLFVDSGIADERFGVLYGDSYLPIEYPAVWEAYHDCGLPALMTVLHNHGQWDTSNAALDAEGRVSYRKRAGADAFLTYIDYGLSVLAARIVLERVPPGTVYDLAGFFEDLGDQGMLAGFEVHERFYEIGSAEGVAALDRLLTCRSEAR